MSETPGINSPCLSKLGSINKTHLTPCRRVGLSRTRKTPTSLVKNIERELSTSEIIEVNNAGFINVSSDLTNECLNPSLIIRPAAEITCDEDRNSLNLHIQQRPKSNYIKKPRTQAAEKSHRKKKRNLLDSDTEDNIESAVLFKPAENMKAEIKNDNKKEIIEKANAGKNSVKSKVCQSLERDENKHITENHRILKVSKSLNSVDSNSKVLNKNNKKLKRFKTNLSTKKSEEKYETDDEFEITPLSPKIKSMQVKLTKLADTVTNYSESEDDPFKSTPEEKFEIKSIDLSDDEFTSTPEEHERTSLLEKIKLMDTKIKNKQDLLDHLMQASVYKFKHRPEVLDELTEKWKNGCVRALNDLLVLLRSHSPMDMITLVKNLKIPGEIVDKLDLG